MPLVKQAEQALKTYLAVREALPEYDEVFIARNGTSMDQRTVRYRIKKYYMEAEIRKKASVHTLRHYAEYRIMSSSLQKQGPLLACCRFILGIIRGRCTRRKRSAGEDKSSQTPEKRHSAIATFAQASVREAAEDFTIMPSMHGSIYSVSDGKK